MCFLLKMGIFHCYVGLPEGIILPWCCLCYNYSSYLLRRGKTGFLLSFFLDKKATVAKWSFFFPRKIISMSHLVPSPAPWARLHIPWKYKSFSQEMHWWNIRVGLETGPAPMCNKHPGTPGEIMVRQETWEKQHFILYSISISSTGAQVVDFLVEKNRCADFLFFKYIKMTF